MVSRFSKTLSGVLLFVSLTSLQAFASCGPADAPDATCLPGTFQGTQNMLQQQAKDREADQKRVMEQNEADAANAAAAADPRNQNNPYSPFYGPRQCEEWKQSFYCTLGIRCTPPNVDCSQYAPKPVARHHRSRNPY